MPKFQRLEVGFVDITDWRAAMHLEGFDGRHENDSRWPQPCRTTFNVKEFLSAKVKTKPRFSHNIIGVTQAPVAWR